MPRSQLASGQLEEVPGGAETLAPLAPRSVPSVSAGRPLRTRGCFCLPPSPSSHASFQRLFALLTFPQLRAILPASKGLLITLMRSGETKRFCDLKQGREGVWEGGNVLACASAAVSVGRRLPTSTLSPPPSHLAEKKGMWTEGLKCIKQLLKRNSFCLSKEQTDTPKTVRISVGVIAEALQG